MTFRLGPSFAAHLLPRESFATEIHPEPRADHLDSMSEMGETESLRLQMAMDRLSKMMSTLSNILHKQSQTQDAIIQNLK